MSCIPVLFARGSPYGQMISKAFNNLFNFERVLWQQKIGWNDHVPKTSDTGEKLDPPSAMFLAVKRFQRPKLVLLSIGLENRLNEGLQPYTGTSFASRFRFCTVAARRNSSSAPFSPLNLRRAKLRLRFRCTTVSRPSYAFYG